MTVEGEVSLQAPSKRFSAMPHTLPTLQSALKFTTLGYAGTTAEATQTTSGKES